MRIQLFLVTCFLCVSTALHAQNPSADQILDNYVKALGGHTALDKVDTRELKAKTHLIGKVVYYWAKPDKVMRESNGDRRAFDGSSGWVLSKKKKLTRLPKTEQTELEINANPIRYARLKDLYSELDAAPPERIAGEAMDVLIAPNNIGSTKFYFDRANHLLVRIEDFGVISAYYKYVTEFLDYKNVDGIQFPFEIVHSTDEPGSKEENIRILKIEQNVDLDPRMFAKPNLGAVTLGGKR